MMSSEDLTGEPGRQSAAPLEPYMLLVEDDFIIALDLEDMLRGLGVATVQIANSVPQALELIDARRPQFGLIDVNLGSDKSFAVAERLRELGIPFVFTTGYGDKYAFPTDFCDVRIVTKPYTIEALRAAIFSEDIPPAAS